MRTPSGMELYYRLAADVVVIVHFGYVGFVLLGQVAILTGFLRGWKWVRNRWFRGIHLLAILIVVAEALLGIVCPLTTLEDWLRALAGQATYEGDFLASWVHDVLFIEAPQWAFTTAYVLFGGLVVGTLFLVPVNWRGTQGSVATKSDRSAAS